MVDSQGKAWMACVLITVIGLIVGAAIVLNQSDDSSDASLQSASECAQSGGVVSQDSQLCFRPNTDRQSWENAAIACAGLSPPQQLAVVKNSADAAAIGASFGSSTTLAWFSLRRRASLSNEFGWSDTDALLVSEINWAAGNPSNGVGANASVVCAGIQTDGKWATRNCADQWAYICAARLAQPPDAPTNVVATFAETAPNMATVTFTAPANNGGSAVTSYNYVVNPGGVSGSWTAAPYTVTGLTANTTYNFSVAAVNKAGAGPFGVSNNLLIEGGSPSAPSNLVLTAGSSEFSVSWTPPTSAGGVGDAIKQYILDVRTGGASIAGYPQMIATTSFKVTSVTDGTTYTVNVQASNFWDHVSPVLTGTVTPDSAVPGAPTISVAKGTQQAIVVNIADGSSGNPSNGGIASRKVNMYDTDGNLVATFTTATTTVTFQYLDATKSYRFAAQVNTASGISGAFSDTSSPLMPDGGAAQAPVVNSITIAGDTASNAGTVTLSFSQVPTPVPQYAVTGPDAARGQCQCIGNGGFPIKAYKVTCTGTGNSFTESFPPQAGFGNQTVTFTGLTAASTYTCTVAAETSDNAGATVAGTASSASSSITTPTSVPGSPLFVTAVAQATAADVVSANIIFTAPYNGGLAITNYTVYPTPNTTSPRTFSVSCAEGVQCPAYTFTGLTIGTAYTFRVSASNAKGESALSLVSNTTATPVANVPEVVSAAPVAVGGQQVITVSWTAPLTNGAAITSYTVQVLDSGNSPLFTETSAVPTIVLSSTAATNPITIGTMYRFRVFATNSVGSAAYSPISSSVAATAGVPHPPANVTATGSISSITVNWAVPTSNGGSSILNYTVRSEDNTFTAVVAHPTVTTTFTSGVVEGVTYYFQVQACNAIGCSPFSTRSNPLEIITSSDGASSLSDGAQAALATIFLVTVVAVLVGTVWCYKKDKFCFDDEEHIRAASVKDGRDAYTTGPSTMTLDASSSKLDDTATDGVQAELPDGDDTV